MNDYPIKNSDNEMKIPLIWRPTIRKIVECMVKGDYSLSSGIEGVTKLSVDLGDRIKSNIESYPGQLVILPEDTWETSVCIWMGKWWDVLVDLWIHPSEQSDLVLSARISEKNGSYQYDVQFVYVP